VTRFVCVHGHAYQPPRESPDTGDVEIQPSAAPFHDWNERITAECYEPLGRAELHGERGAVTSTMNLWSRLSFDLGPTLGVWMDRHAPAVAAVVAEGDVVGGGAMAHPWVHAILPLTPAGDRTTIIRWGIDDFRSRFGHPPKGMWLPETAVDSASLEALADAGIAWTMLAPHQVRLGRGADAARPGAKPLNVTLPSGRSIIVVPYDGELSHGVAFGGLLDDGAKLAHAVVERADASASDTNPLVVLSTDIETFGHHHKFGEMALARAVDEWAIADDVEMITAERYVERFGADRPGWLVERTSWSCAHGVERWRADCGCRMDEVEGQDQRWRRPLRDILDAVADACSRLFHDHATAEFVDPWAARHDYGVVLSSRAEQRELVREHFLGKHLARGGGCWPCLVVDGGRTAPPRGVVQLCLVLRLARSHRDATGVVEARAALVRYAGLTGVDMTDWFDTQVTGSRLGVSSI